MNQARQPTVARTSAIVPNVTGSPAEEGWSPADDTDAYLADADGFLYADDDGPD